MRKQPPRAALVQIVKSWRIILVVPENSNLSWHHRNKKMTSQSPQSMRSNTAQYADARCIVWSFTRQIADAKMAKHGAA